MTTKVRTRDPERTRRRVIDAAAKEFAQRGFDGTTLAGVARRARVSKQLIHHHFGSKEAVFQAVHDSKFRPAVHWRETLPENPADLIATRFEKRKGDQDYLRFLAWEAASARNRIIPGEEDRRQRVAAYGEAIRDMQQRGGLPADMDWRLIQLATLSLATYPIAFTQITRLVTGKDAEDPAFQAEWADFLRVLGRKLFG
jgi:TetR/AcrR family transcriptional regulator